MHRESRTQRADRVIARFAQRQFGTVARWQLLAAGVTGDQIRTRLEAGRLTEIHRGVYLVGHVKPKHATEMAALLALHLRATISHRSALASWDLFPYPASAPVWVTVPPEMGTERGGLKVVRAKLSPRDRRARGPLRVTSPPRTILDSAAFIKDLYELERIVAEAHFRGLAREPELKEQLARNPGKRGNKRLRRVLGLPGGPRRTRSTGERVLLRLLREGGITGFEMNQKVLGHEVDLFFPDANLVVELDGWDGHSSRQAFERDRLKWAKLQAADYRVMPVTGRQLRDDPDGVVARIVAALRL